jgi:glycosyltransferase involved in cell wall biosynthesis
MKILFVAPWIPSRVRPRSLGILRELARHHEVAFVGLDMPGEITDDLLALPLAQVELVTQSPTRAKARALAALPTRRSLQIAYAAYPELATRCRAVATAFQPDVAHFNVLRSAGSLKAVGDLPILFDFDDVRSDYYAQLATDPDVRVRERMLGRLEGPRMNRAELRILDRVDVAVVSSPLDTARLRTPRGAASLIRSPHDMPAHERWKPNGSQSILFVGRMGYRPNHDAAVWFLDNVMPKVLERVPTAVLDIVGELPSPELTARSSGHLRVHGRVPSVAPYYLDAGASIVPIDVGTGVQMKLIQSASLGVPSVATGISVARADGLPLGAHRDWVLVADDAEQWAKQLVAILTSENGAAQLGSAARQWAGDTYTAGAIASQVQAAYSRFGINR